MKEALLAILVVVLIYVGLWFVGHEADDGGASIEFWCYGTGGADNPGGVFWTQTARRFEKAHPGVRVRIVADIPHGQYNSVLTTRFISGKAPDVFVVDDGFVAELANEGQIEPLAEYIRHDPTYDLADYAPSMVRDGLIGGVRYSIPWYGGFGCLFYRTDLFALAGVQPPKTWAELLAVCRTLRDHPWEAEEKKRRKREQAEDKKGGMPYRPLPHPLTLNPVAGFWMMPWIWQAGGRILSDDRTRVTIDTPEFLAGVRFVHDLMHKHGFVDPGLAEGTKSIDLWATGQAAMMIDGGWTIARLDTLYPNLKGKWDTAMLPMGRNKVCFYGGQHLLMNARSRHKKLAWQFMAFAASSQNQLRWTVTGSPPCNLKTILSPDFRQKYPRFALLPDVMRYGRNNPFAPFFQEIWYNRFQNAVLQSVMAKADPDLAAAIREAAGDMQKAVDDFWETHDRATYKMQGSPRPKDEGNDE